MRFEKISSLKKLGTKKFSKLWNWANSHLK